MPAIRAIAAAHDTLEAWPQRPDYLDHELATGTVVVAEDGDGIAGFGAAVVRDGVHHLGDLFVRPGREGGGAGRAMLAQLLPAAGPRTTFSSSDRRALALYARRGLVPVSPLLHLRGEAAPAGVGDAGAGAGGDPDAAAAMDAQLRGYGRPQDHRFLAAAGAEVRIWGRAFAYLRTAGATTHVGPCGDLDGGASTVLAAVALALGRSPVAALALPGPHPALAPLLDAGFRIVDVDTIMTSPADLLDWRGIVPDTDLG
jgi:GNAT superfamily N-acetyltransferase